MLVVAPAGSFHHHQQQRAVAGDDAVLPLITAAQRTLVDAADAGKPPPPPVSSAGAIQFWHQELAAADGSSPGKKALAGTMDHGRAGSGGATCHDCGNQAKKGCAHSRCRTCCNSRGFECDTHVRSTWVPAARRRERLHLGGGSAGGGGGTSPPPTSPAATKKPRLACPITTTTTTTNSRASTSNATTPRSFDTSSSHQDASFKDSLPRQVRGPAVFRCVRVTSVDDGGGGGEVAYQAAVTINGHLFRGLLYDHGAEADGRVAPTASDLNLSSAAAAAPNLYGGGSAPLILGGLGYGNTP